MYMFTILFSLCVISFTFALVYLKKKFLSHFLFLFAGVFLLASTITPLLMNLVVSDELCKEKKFDIISVKDNQSIYGYISLFGGSINEEFYYYFYKLEGEGKVLDRLYSKDCIIYEENIENGYIIENVYKMNKKEFNKWKHWGWFFVEEIYEGYKYEIHVPNGTISSEFLLDAE